MNKKASMQSELLAVADCLEKLAAAIDSDAENERLLHEKKAGAESFDYGTVGTRVDPSGAVDPLTKFCIS